MFFELKDNKGRHYFPVQIYATEVSEAVKSFQELLEFLESSKTLYVSGSCSDVNGNIQRLHMALIEKNVLVSISECKDLEMGVSISDILTLTEAASKWRLADGATIRKAIERGKFDDLEVKRSGRTWLVTYQAMERVFGSIKDDLDDLYVPYNHLMYLFMNAGASLNSIKHLRGTLSEKELHDVPFVGELKDLLAEIQTKADLGAQVIVTNSEMRNSSIKKIIGSSDELKLFFKYLNECGILNADLSEIYGIKVKQ